ncbi:uncharacterized protein B0H18DRAFT_1117479 [Fomitopsis serialis]|uniref:uncharacterized protein n=1 Tax=Fomitopsis serialis TaxID=139415 RepID=UPI002007C248|nr:uncharacterized protein B0H18DRAFT_1117479 [Neoantrodia serialis]KAH9929446.1 hypothetical protein B0H18DRAFT_1117479 [Neoantrodia serialis]
MAGPTVHLVEEMLVALYIGGLILFCLYGMAMGQAAFYYVSYPDDRRSFKVFVATLFILNTVEFVAAARLLYQCIIEDHSTYATVTQPVSDTAVNVSGWTVVFMSQCFYLHSLHSLLQPQRKAVRLMVVITGVVPVVLGFSSFVVGVVQ